MAARNVRDYLDYITEKHLHNEEIWTPAICTTAIPVLTNALADNFGNWVNIINPTTQNWIDLHRLLIVNPLVSAIPADGVYHLEIGIADVRITEVRWVIDAAVGNNFPREPIDIICPRIPIGSRVSCRAKSSTAGVNTLQLQFGYHPYDM